MWLGARVCRLSVVTVISVPLLILVVLNYRPQMFSSQDVDIPPPFIERMAADAASTGFVKNVLEETGANSTNLITYRTGTPCVYEDEVDLRIIVMTYNRAKSVSRCLAALQALELDGDSASLEIWIDRSKDKKVHAETVNAARSFVWSKGVARVHVQTKHAGIYGQWIDTWRPREDSRELAIILEDDIDLSPYAYRWLKAAVHRYGHDGIAGYGLSEIQHYNAGMGKNPNDLVYLFKRIGTHGFAPSPKHWRSFQDWYHSKPASFHPYVKADKKFTRWYKYFEKIGKAKGMWSIWLIRYCSEKKLNTLYANIAQHAKANRLKYGAGAHFAYHRQEKGLHFNGKKKRQSSDKIITEWHDYFVEFSNEVPLYAYNGKKT